MRRSVDSTRSTIRIRTFAEGLFAKLAHDLELVCRDVRGTADEASGQLEIPIDRIEVAGVLKNGKVDAGVLSASDRADIVSRMRSVVFHGAGNVTIEAAPDSVKITPPHGKTVTRPAKLSLTDDRVAGSLDVSLEALGSDPVKGPMNAFRVKDRVEVHFDVVLAADDQPA